jgi:serine/threonine protein kinase
MTEEKSVIVSHGRYGLIICPPVTTDKKYQSKDYVLKYTKRELITKEYMISQMLRKYDPDGDLFVLAEKDTLREENLSQFPEVKQLYLTELAERDPSENISRVGDLQSPPNETKFGSMILPFRGKSYDINEDITIEELWKRTCQLIKILSILKKINVIHYDLRAANVVIDEKGNLRLLDFGSCFYRNHTEGIITNLLTQIDKCYLAPEVAFFVTVLLRDNPNKAVRASIEEFYTQYEYLIKYYEPEYRKADPVKIGHVSDFNNGDKRDFISKLYNSSVIDRQRLLNKHLFKIDIYSAMHIINDHLRHIIRNADKFDDKQKEIWKKLCLIINSAIHPNPDKTYDIESFLEYIK